jgi:hypothetical protein
VKKQRALELEEAVRHRWNDVRGVFDERAVRRWAAAEARAIGHGGIMVVHRATGVSRRRIGEGLKEIDADDKPKDLVRVRRCGGGRKKKEQLHPELVEGLKELVEPATRGDPESSLHWTSKSTRSLATELYKKYKVRVCQQVVSRLLKAHGYRLQAARKTVEGKQHPDRNKQFEYIQAEAERRIRSWIPVISVDAKKKELVGNFKNGGRRWLRTGEPELTNVHDVASQGFGRVTPYGVYDVGNNSGFVNVGVDHDTGTFAVASIEAWWERMGCKRYPNARSIYITADGGGSNGHRLRSWKYGLQRFADKYGITVNVSHFPPGTSKWNKIEHRLFSFISLNWRGRPLRTYEIIVNLISNTKTDMGLIVTAQMDWGKYPVGKQITDAQMREIDIKPEDFHGEWNYAIRPRRKP